MSAKGAKLLRPQTSRDPSGIQSVEIALNVLQTLVRQNSAASLSDLSRATGLQPSKLHRYLVSLVRTGMVGKSPVTGLYDLGPAARQLGIAAFNRFDSFKVAQERVVELANETGHDALLYIWSEHGATLIGQQSGIYPMPMVLRLGSTVPLRRSAVGHVFLAYLPTTHTAPLVSVQKEDLEESEDETLVQRRLEQIRNDRYYWSTRTILPGGVVLAVPVFSAHQQLHCVLALALTLRNATPQRKEMLIAHMLKVASSLSNELGATAQERA